MLAVLFAPAAAAAPAPGTFAEIDRFVADHAREHGIPGVAVSVLDGDDEHVFTVGDGITPDTGFPVGSESKAFGSVAALQLVEAGVLDLDRPVLDYLPELRTTDPAVRGITVDMLLRMTSALDDRAYEGIDPGTDPAGAVAAIEDLRTVAPPGAGFVYSNINFVLVARIVEKVSGLPYDGYLRTRVFEPLGMRATTTVRRGGEIRPATLPGLTTGHTVVLGRSVPWPEPDLFHVGAGDVVSTAADMARWLRFVRGAGATGDALPPGRLDEQRRPLDPARNPYSIGWLTYPPTDRLPERLYSGGDLVTYHCDVVVEPATGAAVSVLVSTNLAFPPVRLPLVYREIATGITDILRGDPPGSTGDPISAGDQPAVRLASDAVPLAGTLVAALGAAVAVLRARAWARPRATWRRALSVLGLLALFAVPFVAWALFSGLAGTPVPIAYLLASWPSAVVAAAPAVAAVLVALARARALRLGPRDVGEQPAGR